MQLNFLQEDLAAALQESKRIPTSGARTKLTSSVDLFGGLPLAMPPDKPGRKTARKTAKNSSGNTVSEINKGEACLQKSATAFKTISEAADMLNVPQHVLRFWESRFSQIKPLKMGGGRRYYRPEDIDILSKIQNLLYKQGYTIKGAKKAFGLTNTRTTGIKTGIDNIPIMNRDLALTDKQKKQVAAIRKELLNLRETLRPYL